MTETKLNLYGHGLEPEAVMGWEGESLLVVQHQEMSLGRVLQLAVPVRLPRRAKPAHTFNIFPLGLQKEGEK